MTQGKSGAKAPDRNRGRERPCHTPRRATYEEVLQRTPTNPYLEYPENFDFEIEVAATCTCGANSASTLATVHRVVGTAILIAATASPR
jgi:hypothetical protein